jgi:predicted RNase H-like HicB family nuclease
MKNEITFIVEDAIEGGYTAHALGENIITEADTIDELHEMVRDAVDCHFETDQKPKIIHLHFTRDEVIAA